MTETKLKEYAVNEKEVHQILTQVNVTRRECEIVRKFLFVLNKTFLIQQFVEHSVGRELLVAAYDNQAGPMVICNQTIDL